MIYELTTSAYLGPSSASQHSTCENIAPSPMCEVFGSAAGFHQIVQLLLGSN